MALKIAFIHPDLGIGGAERLVVDAAVGLQSRGHQVRVFTSHHDRNHCFEETRDGTLTVRVQGDFLPRSLFGYGYIICAMLRGLWLAWMIVFEGMWRKGGPFDVIVVDQLSLPVPVLRLTGAR
ncbi:Alpha-1,3-mannosyltransferase-like protein, partial [Quaeritorhiza haematococci]